MKRPGQLRTAPLKRGQPMKRGAKPLARTARLRARRVSKRFARMRNPAYCGYIRTLPCVVSSDRCAGSVQCCHVRTRAAGGYDVGGTYPGCAFHHGLQHQMGIESFQKLYSLDLAQSAARYAERYAAEGAT